MKKKRTRKKKEVTKKMICVRLSKESLEAIEYIALTQGINKTAAIEFSLTNIRNSIANSRAIKIK